MKFYLPVRLFTGSGVVAEHADDIASFGKKCLIVTGASSAQKSGALGDALAALTEKAVSYVIYDKITANPLLTSCIEAGKLGADADFVLGIGGGSPLDAARAAAVFAANPGMDENGLYSKVWPNRPLPIVLIGTTAGTGSEVTSVSVLTDSKGKKHSVSDPRLFSALSLGDPAYTRSMPLPVTVSTGIDAFAHSAESYLSRTANPFSKAAASAGIRLLYAPLMKAITGETLTDNDRADLYDASILGGVAISVTGTCMPHNVGYFLTEKKGLPHGIACAMLFESMADIIRERNGEKWNEFLKDTGFTTDEILSLVRGAVKGVSFPLTGEEIETELPRWENSKSVKNTLGEITTEDIRKALGKFVK